ncbi:dihydrofolate synthase/folylpolyglutamate synthase [Litorimonas taeanensis]|uniref:Dihydrofolate synthase/folylpolyglutamate synthase n=1 Tax=Litorimonas taeanensis TaxID=568099 RepID=A0A420WIH9_9PROT|nr:folylpolyglutamate synthase/dihydrofolate synthase family protein [Litorimonas taeanensis]RKQ70834.1 dihydrofolate synthase/folylpolyglutamate synthase [Litorimonas taeanensis]
MTETVEQALATLRALHPKKIDLGLERIQSVLDKLGNPETKLPPIIHVAGTNGKGSTLAFIRAIAEASGLKAHVYTSPHLVRFHERIVLAGNEITDDKLVDVLARVRKANAGAPLSFFEATTAAAYLAFSESSADVALIEVGLGGRYDATNVITPDCCAITPVDFDHAEFLGRDLAGIAKEKAGIIKPHAPVFCGPQLATSRDVLESEAQKSRAVIKFWNEDFRAYRQHGRLVYESQDTLSDFPLPALRGEHQISNAGLAIAVAKHMKWTDVDIATGLKHAFWPARMQNLTQGIYAEMARQAGAELWLDGGHNPHAARAVANTMAELEQVTERPLILITGILANKDIGGFLDAFEGLASAVIGVSIPDHESLAPETLRELALSRNMDGFVASDISSAINKAIEFGGTVSSDLSGLTPIPPRILICGSLYLAGEVLKG